MRGGHNSKKPLYKGVKSQQKSKKRQKEVKKYKKNVERNFKTRKKVKIRRGSQNVRSPVEKVKNIQKVLQVIVHLRLDAGVVAPSSSVDVMVSTLCRFVPSL